MKRFASWILRAFLQEGKNWEDKIRSVLCDYPQKLCYRCFLSGAAQDCKRVVKVLYIVGVDLQERYL